MYFDPQPFDLAGSLQFWAMNFGAMMALVFGTAFLLSVILNGARGVKVFFREIWNGIDDLIHISPRRVWALTRLTMKESVRRKTLMVIVVFGICFLFAGWFLSASRETGGAVTGEGGTSINSVNVYVSFVLTAISYLILPAVFILACWTIPDDIKVRSMHTVVTKPVRRVEVYLGRILGITLVGTGVVLVMGTVGYFWLARSLQPEAAAGQLVARVPVYGKFSFIGPDGQPSQTGINTGDVWEFRSYIEGNSRSRAVWDFENVVPRGTTKSLRLESNIQVFRTLKGDVGQGVLCQLTFVNPTTNARASYRPIPIKEFRTQVLEIDPGQLFNDQNEPVDLFSDLVDKGKLRVEAACLSRQQYLGMARPDLFIRNQDARFEVGFAKAVFGIWEMMFMLIIIGVTSSCFVKGPVATLLSLTIVIIGLAARSFLVDLVDKNQLNALGGPLESSYRIVMHMNPAEELPPGIWTTIAQAIDTVFKQGVTSVRYIFPNFEYFDLAPYIANGYDVPWDAALLPGIAIILAYLIPCIIIGLLSLKLRELEAK